MLNFITAFTSTTDSLLSSTTTTIDTKTFMLCTLVSLILGAVIAFAFTFKQRKSKGFAATLALLPVIVQVVIMLVNGNLGTGVAVMGAFSLVRFRSMPGSAKDILAIFLSMAVGLATGTDYLVMACIFTAVVCILSFAYTMSPFGEAGKRQKTLSIVIPESLDYTEVFDDIFKKYTDHAELVNVKTTNMGSLFKLSYDIELKRDASEKQLIDELRVRNGNLEISCSRVADVKDQL